MDKHLKKALKAAAHHLQPIIIIGSGGYSEGVKAELERALDIHELIKVRINAETREERDEIADSIASTHRAERVGSIGHILIIYRERKEK